MSFQRNTAYNIVGTLVPALLALVTIPLYISTIGTDRFGALSIVWIISGALGFFDLGLTRASAFRVAELANAADEQRGRAIGTAIITATCISLVAAALSYIFSFIYFQQYFVVAAEIKTEIADSFVYIGLLVLISLLSNVVSGILQGSNRFLGVNLLNVISAISTFSGPLIYFYLASANFTGLVQAILLGRIIALVMGFAFLHYRVIAMRHFKSCLSEAKRLLSFGRWVMTSAIIAPVIMYSDRAMIGSFLGSHFVALYTMPFQLAQRMTIIPNAISSAIYPTMVKASADYARHLCQRSNDLTVAILTTPAVIAIFAMPWLMDLWLGRQIGPQASVVAQIIVVAFWFNSLGVTYFSALEAQGRPHITTIILAIEMPFYLAFQYWALTNQSIELAALVFAGRSAIDALALYYFSRIKLNNILETLITAAIIISALVISRTFDDHTFAYIVSGFLLTALTAILAYRLVHAWVSKNASQISDVTAV